MIPLLFLLACICGAAVANEQPAASGGGGYCYTRMFSFGDSITDTGNQVSFFPTAPAASAPYGETFFHRPTGRYSDDRLIVDFLAEALGLPYLTAFLHGKTAEDFRRGANFAVSASTALSQDFFRQMGLDLTIIPPYSLDVQLEWFKGVLHSLASTNQGIPPMGCIPRFLNMFPSKNPSDYDKLGCLKWLNNFSQYHNRALKRMQQRIQHYPTVTLVYAD